MADVRDLLVRQRCASLAVRALERELPEICRQRAILLRGAHEESIYGTPFRAAVSYTCRSSYFDVLIDVLHAGVYLLPVRWIRRLPDLDQSSPVLRGRGAPICKSLEHLTSTYTIHDLKTPTSQKNGVVTSEKPLTRAA